MFPLGAVLFPHAMMPLRVFEPRYRAMTESCLRGDGRFGVVLIERGSEVGGGDSRFDFGTIAQIAEAARTPDGRYLLATVGTDRIRIKKWLDDDPYPRAEIDIVGEPTRVDARARDQRVEIERLLKRVIALGSELGYRAPDVGTVRLDDDPLRASYEASALAPIASLDAHRLLQLDDPCQRFDELGRLLSDAAEVFEFRLSGGSSGSR
jgi:Lon protease-like protein